MEPIYYHLPRLNILTLHQVGPQQPEARPAAVQLLPGEGSAETRPQCAPQEPEENQETEKFQETKQDESSEEEAVASMDFILYVEFLTFFVDSKIRFIPNSKTVLC